MNLLELITGKADYVTIVKQFILKVFVHESSRNACLKSDIKIVISCDNHNNISIHSFDNFGHIIRTISDNEVQEILMK
jgi:hypothetical protein